MSFVKKRFFGVFFIGLFLASSLISFSAVAESNDEPIYYYEDVLHKYLHLKKESIVTGAMRLGLAVACVVGGSCISLKGAQRLFVGRLSHLSIVEGVLHISSGAALIGLAPYHGGRYDHIMVSVRKKMFS